MKALKNAAQTLRVFAADLVQGFFEVTHRGFAVLGLLLVMACVVLGSHPDLRQAAEARLMGWLQARAESSAEIATDVDASDRATAANPQDLPKRQAALAYWLSRKYRVAPEPLSALIAEAYELGERTRLEPTLILATMAVESGFNPFAQSPVGAQGLMQVMTRVHNEKFRRFGGEFAAFDPVANLRVGVKVLQDCIARAGSVEAGLKQYVGATAEDDGGYAAKVLGEHARLREVLAGKSPSIYTPAPAIGSPVAASTDQKIALLSAP